MQICEQIDVKIHFLYMKKYITLFLFLLSSMVITVSSCRYLSSDIALDVDAKPLEYLSQYNFFKGDVKNLIPNVGLLPYDLISPLFSDYAHKARFVYVPKGQQTEYNDAEALNLPVGGCYIKNFYYPFDFRDESKGRRLIETRMLVHREKGWDAFTYIWNDEQTDAKFDVAGDIKKVSWIHDDGTKKEVDYIVPNKNQCKGCHWENNVGIKPIGPKSRNLNMELTYTDGAKNQIDKWTEIGILKGAPKSVDCPKTVSYDDTSASLDLRAKSYLDINCAHCHRATGPAYTSGLYVDYNQENSEHRGISKSPVAAGIGTGGLLMDVVPGKPDESIMVFRMESEEAGIKMPEVGRSLVHKEGVELIRKWISAMKTDSKKD